MTRDDEIALMRRIMYGEPAGVRESVNTLTPVEVMWVVGLVWANFLDGDIRDAMARLELPPNGFDRLWPRLESITRTDPDPHVTGEVWRQIDKMPGIEVLGFMDWLFRRGGFMKASFIAGFLIGEHRNRKAYRACEERGVGRDGGTA